MILFDIYVYSTFYSIGIWNVSYTCWIGTLVFLLPFTSPLHSSGILFRFLKHLLLTLFLPSTLPFRRCFCILRPPPCPFHLSYGIYFSIFEGFFLSRSKLAVRPSCTTLILIGLNEPDENLSERCLRVIDEINTFDVLFIQMALTIRMFTHRLIVQFNQNKNMTIIDSLDHNIHFMPISTEWQLWQMLFSGIQFFVYFC